MRIPPFGREILRGKPKKMENLEMSTIVHGIMSKKLKIMENEKLPLYDLKNDEITAKCQK